MTYYIFNDVETGQVWSVKAETFEEAKDELPEEAEWDDWFQL